MIVFLCKCGQTISVKDDEAGLSMQCPGCKCLVDVPTINDLESMESDGTLRMQPELQTPPQLHEKMRAFGKKSDMRMNVDEFLAIGDEIPLADEIAPKKTNAKINRPRYDNITGELIREIPLADEAAPVVPSPADIPMAQATLNYANFNTEDHSPLSFRHVPIRILTGTNVLCLFFVWLAHGGFFFTLLPPMLGALALPLVFLSIIAVVAHYGVVMEAIGVNEQNELPTFFQRASLSEDFYQPALAMVGALAVAALPALVMMMCAPQFRQRPHIIVALWIVAALLWPAFALTAATSGASNNLLPHRALSVITAAPLRYLLCLVPYLIGLACYVALGGWVVVWLGDWLGYSSGSAVTGLMSRFGGVFITCFAGTYFMHIATVWLALMYRSQYHKFNWVLQRHVKSDRKDTMQQLRELRHAGDPRVNRTVQPNQAGIERKR